MAFSLIQLLKSSGVPATKVTPVRGHPSAKVFLVSVGGRYATGGGVKAIADRLVKTYSSMFGPASITVSPMVDTVDQYVTFTVENPFLPGAVASWTISWSRDSVEDEGGQRGDILVDILPERI
jgi:hypothetical protein